MTKLVHLGIIMDGNRRWAKARGLPSSKGHYYGYLKVLDLVDWAIAKDIKILSLFAFSTENWKRARREVNYLMALTKMVFHKHLSDFKQKGAKILVSGVKDKLSKNLIKIIEIAQAETKENNRLIVNICFNYGGRREIIEAVKKIIKDKIPASKITEEVFKKYLFQDLPYPDVIVRTSGEQRLSNFLLWQAAYAELIFIKKHWPAFTQRDLKNILKIYQKRQRRFGK